MQTFFFGLYCSKCGAGWVGGWGRWQSCLRRGKCITIVHGDEIEFIARTLLSTLIALGNKFGNRFATNIFIFLSHWYEHILWCTLTLIADKQRNVARALVLHLMGKGCKISSIFPRVQLGSSYEGLGAAWSRIRPHPIPTWHMYIFNLFRPATGKSVQDQRG